MGWEEHSGENTITLCGNTRSTHNNLSGATSCATTMEKSHNNGEKPQQWGKATTMGRHNRLFVAACFCFCYFYNCPNRVISVQHTTSQQKSTNEEQMTAGERYKSQTTARHQNRFMQTSTAQHQMIIDFGPLYLFSTAATTVVSYGYWLAVRTPRCQCGHHLIIKL